VEGIGECAVGGGRWLDRGSDGVVGLVCTAAKKWPSSLSATACLAAICWGGVAVLLPFAMWEMGLASTPAWSRQATVLTVVAALVPGLGAYWINGWLQKNTGCQSGRRDALPGAAVRRTGGLGCAERASGLASPRRGDPDLAGGLFGGPHCECADPTLGGCPSQLSHLASW
jgi:hypothetical protein